MSICKWSYSICSLCRIPLGRDNSSLEHATDCCSLKELVILYIPLLSATDPSPRWLSWLTHTKLFQSRMSLTFDVGGDLLPFSGSTHSLKIPLYNSAPLKSLSQHPRTLGLAHCLHLSSGPLYWWHLRFARRHRRHGILTAPSRFGLLFRLKYHISV